MAQVFNIGLIIISLTLSNCKTCKYKDPKYTVKERVNDLIFRMTLEEKVKQLQCLVFQDVIKDNKIDSNGIGGIAFIRVHLPVSSEEEVDIRNQIQKYAVEKTRLGIPILFHCEALHGLVDKGSTSFPQAIGLASTWNTELVYEISNKIAIESKSRGFRQVLSPTVDIARDVRWGRVAETYGEDPYLTSRMAVAFCKGFEENNVITTLKHFVANSGPGGRDSHPVHHSERHLMEVYFQPYMHAIKEAGVRSVMASYNAVDGLPSGINKWLLTDVLRNKWGFDGTVVTDYQLIGKLYNQLMVASTRKEAAILALKAGLDRDLPRIGEGNGFEDLVAAYHEGLIDENQINTAVKRVLKQKFELGLFEDPYSDPDFCVKVTNTPENKLLALEAARQSLVMLKNSNNILPIDNIKRIVVLGEDAIEEQLGDYSPWDIDVVTILEGLKNEAPEGITVNYADINFKTFQPIDEQYFYNKENGQPGFFLEYYENDQLEGAPVYRNESNNISFHWGNKGPNQIKKGKPFSMRMKGSFTSPWDKKVNMSLDISGGARLYINNNLIFNNWDDPYLTQQFFTFNFEKGKAYDIILEYNSSNSYSKCILDWEIVPRDQIEIRKVNGILKDHDLAIVVAGITEKESQDRANLDLPKETEALIDQANKAGIPIVVVLTVGSAVTMNNWFEKVDAIICAWYPGQEGGKAVAEALFGKYNPGGKLTITFPYSVAQCPLYYNYKPSGRGYGYVDLTGEPRFEFGYGLSYTSFKYSHLTISPNIIRHDQKTKVSCKITNVGNFKGDEVVQLYIHDKIATTVRPVKELKAFKRISLEPGETKQIDFWLSKDELSMYNTDLEFVVEPGDFEIMIGSSSKDIRLNGILSAIK